MHQMSPTRRHQAPARAQSGAVLVVGLVLLMLMTLLGVAGMSNTTITERIAGNQRDRNTALQSGEAALRGAEAQLDASPPATLDPMTAPGDLSVWNTCWDSVSSDCPDDHSHAYDLTRSSFAAADWGIDGAAEYYVEELLPGTHATRGSLDAAEKVIGSPTYRITTRAVGASPNAVVILQSTYRTH